MRDEYEYFKSVKETKVIDQRVQQWISCIALHGHKEEIAFYPRIESYLNDQKKGGRHLIEHGIKEHRELETEWKKLAEQSATNWKQRRKTVQKLVHHLEEEERDIHRPLKTKLHEQLQIEMAKELVEAGRVASGRPHPELSRDPDRSPQENIETARAEKRKKE